MNLPPITLLIGTGLMLLQFLLSVPWVVLLFLTPSDRDKLRQNPFAPWVMQRIALAVGLSIAAPVLLLTFVQDRSSLEITGRIYAAVLQIQLIILLFFIIFAVMLKVWPKGGAIALSAFREGVRQPMLWLLTVVAAIAMFLSIIIPYFTFGEDYLMVKQLGYDVIMLAAVIFGGLAASLSISEEIEGRTAITVMSKPVSRRQFMIGKFVGILLAALVMFGLLGVYFEGVLIVKHWWDKLEPLTQVVESQSNQVYIGVVQTPLWVTEPLERWDLPGGLTDFLRGFGQWTAHSLDTLPGLVLCYSQVMVLVGLAVALATRVPMVVNLVAVLFVFLMSHLTPVLVTIAKKSQVENPGPVSQLLAFVSRVFDTVLPDLGLFSMDPALLTDAPPPAVLFTQYVSSVTLYGVVYTAVVLILGLILFEDRDLA